MNCYAENPAFSVCEKTKLSLPPLELFSSEYRSFVKAIRDVLYFGEATTTLVILILLCIHNVNRKRAKTRARCVIVILSRTYKVLWRYKEYNTGFPLVFCDVILRSIVITFRLKLNGKTLGVV